MAARSAQGGVAAPAVAGLVAAATALLTALALTVIPALIAQISAQHSPMTSLEAIVLGIDALTLAHGGSLLLDTDTMSGTVNLTPFGLTAVLVLVAALACGRAQDKLHLIADDGTLRPHGPRDGATALAAFVLLYAIGFGALTALARAPEVRPVVLSAVVSGALVAAIGGIAGTLSAVRRGRARSASPITILGLVPAPYGELARAVAVALTGLAGLGILAVAGTVLLRFGEVAAIFDGLDPGIGGGIVLTLLQLALLPLLAVWALAVLLGGTVTLGADTGISYQGVETGVLPALPLLGALPGPGTWPAWVWLFALLPTVVVGAGAVLLVRALERVPPRERLLASVAYPLVLFVAVLAVMGLATGSIGGDRLQSLGPQITSLLLPLLLIVTVPSALVLGIPATGLIPWLRRVVDGLRHRVERAEGRIDGSRDGAEDPSGDADPDPGDADEDDRDAGDGIRNRTGPRPTS